MKTTTSPGRKTTLPRKSSADTVPSKDGLEKIKYLANQANIFRNLSYTTSKDSKGRVLSLRVDLDVALNSKYITYEMYKEGRADYDSKKEAIDILGKNLGNSYTVKENPENPEEVCISKKRDFDEEDVKIKTQRGPMVPQENYKKSQHSAIKLEDSRGKQSSLITEITRIISINNPGYMTGDISDIVEAKFPKIIEERKSKETLSCAMSYAGTTEILEGSFDKHQIYSRASAIKSNVAKLILEKYLKLRDFSVLEIKESGDSILRLQILPFEEIDRDSLYLDTSLLSNEAKQFYKNLVSYDASAITYLSKTRFSPSEKILRCANDFARKKIGKYYGEKLKGITGRVDPSISNRKPLNLLELVQPKP